MVLYGEKCSGHIGCLQLHLADLKLESVEPPGNHVVVLFSVSLKQKHNNNFQIALELFTDKDFQKMRFITLHNSPQKNI